jgi:hypothetical protein
MSVLVSIVAILVTLGLPLAILSMHVAMNHRNRRRLMELHHIERMAAIERGLELPPLPVALLEGSRRRSTSLLPGLIWSFAGIALIVAMRSTGGSEGMIGLVPAAVGVAYLVYYFAEGRKLEARAFEAEKDHGDWALGAGKN